MEHEKVMDKKVHYIHSMIAAMFKYLEKWDRIIL